MKIIYHVLILGLIIVLAFGSYWYVEASQPVWSINTTECVNQPIKIGENQTDINSEIINKTIQVTPGYNGVVCIRDNGGYQGYSGNCVESPPVRLVPLYAYREWDCSESFNYWQGDTQINKVIPKNCSKRYSLNDLQFNITDTNYRNGFRYSIGNAKIDVKVTLVINKTYLNIQDINRIQKVCSPKQVSSMIINCSENNEEGCSNPSKATFKINKEWLDKKCECIENIKSTSNSAENSINVPCSKYKCYFSNITYEVTRQ
jgi:hypothetical protein